MKTVIQRLLGALLLLSTTVHAQETEHWDGYVLNYEKGPGSTLLDLSLKSAAPIPARPYLLITGVNFKKATPDGLPQAKELVQLHIVSDSIHALMNRQGNATLAGTYTYQNQRMDYYYIGDTVNVRAQLARLYKRHFKHYTPSIEITCDSTWEVYTGFLYPNDQVYEYMQNEKVVVQLQRAGDSLTLERRVDHMLYFSTANDRDHFIDSYAKEARFHVEHEAFIAAEDKPFQLQISRRDRVDISSISKVTGELRKHAQQDHGLYDGWETFVAL